MDQDIYISRDNMIIQSSTIYINILTVPTCLNVPQDRLSTKLEFFFNYTGYMKLIPGRFELTLPVVLYTCNHIILTMVHYQTTLYSSTWLKK